MKVVCDGPGLDQCVLDSTRSFFIARNEVMQHLLGYDQED